MGKGDGQQEAATSMKFVEPKVSAPLALRLFERRPKLPRRRPSRARGRRSRPSGIRVAEGLDELVELLPGERLRREARSRKSRGQAKLGGEADCLRSDQTQIPSGVRSVGMNT